MSRFRQIPVLAALAAFLAAALPVAAQNPFAPVARVDERVVTLHELEQRALLLELFNTPGDLREQALETLIDERLQKAEAARMGIRLTPEEVTGGMEEFAGRFQLTVEEFVALIAEEGVTAEAFRDFVEAGLSWRSVLRARFENQLNVTDPEVDRAMSLSAQRGELRVLLSELVLPATPDNIELAELIASDSTPEQFEEAARLYSLAPSRDNGGRLEWAPLASLPPLIRPVVEAMEPGQVSAPIPVEGAVVLLLLRGSDRSLNLPPSAIRVDYVRAVLPAERAAEDLGRLRARVDACADFLGVLGYLPETANGIETATLATLPAGVGQRIARIDAGEIDAETRPDGSVDALMLCSRTPGTAEEAPDRNASRERLIDQRLAQLSGGLLAELRAAAVIERP